MKRLGRFFLLTLLVSTSACTNRLVVTSTPVGARVAVNDADYGLTPLTIDKLQPGVYAVEVSKAGYQAWRSEIEVKGEQAISAVLVPSAPVPAPDRAPTAAPAVSAIHATKLTVFVEPVSGDVYVDDVLRGYAEAGMPVVVTFSEIPTMTMIEVRADGYQNWRGKVALEAGRDNHLYVTMDPLPLSTGFLSDAEVLRLAVADVVGAAAAVPGLERGARIEVLSLVRRQEDDDPVMSLLKDVFIEELSQAGFTPAERDDDLLVQLAHSTAGERLPYRVLTRKEGADEPFVYDAELLAREEEYQTFMVPTTKRVIKYSPQDAQGQLNSIEKVTITEDQEVVRFSHTVYPITGHIPTADQFLAFRILDLGITKNPIEGAMRLEPMLYRRAKVRLHVRVIDAKEGTIRWAGVLGGERGDEVPTRIAASLASPEFRVYTGTLPELDVAPPEIRAAQSSPGIVISEPTLR